MTRQSARRLSALPWLVLAIVGCVIDAALSAKTAQTAWIYLKRTDGTIQKKIATEVPAGGAVHYVSAPFVMRDPGGTMHSVVAWVPFVPIITMPPSEFPALPVSARLQLEQNRLPHSSTFSS